MNKIKYILLALLFTCITLNASSLRIELPQLAQNIDKYTILDVRQRSTYLDGHIKGALNFPSTSTFENQGKNGKIANPLKMQEAIRNLGLDANHKIVIYGNKDFFDSARLFWALEVYGFTNVKLLNGSFDEWIKKNNEVSKTESEVKQSSYIAKIDHKRLATQFQTQIASKNPNQTIIDARGFNSFVGKESSAQRFGHIPSAIHVPADHNISYENDTLKLKSLDKLKELYVNVGKENKIIIYCAIGKVATANYFALRELGYNVSNYDASWKEWGNDYNLPITNLSKK